MMKTKGWTLFSFGLALAAAACSSDSTPPEDLGAVTDAAVADGAPQIDAAPQVDSAPDSQPPWKAPFDPTVCKMKPHSWLPPASMGKVVSQQKSMIYSLSKQALAMLLQLSKYKGSIKPLYDVTVYLYRYETQDRGVKTEATAAMAFPTLPAGTPKTAPYVLWLHGTSGFSDACAPTSGGGADAALPVALMASQGYIGVAPDFIGMNGFGAPSTLDHAYLVGEPAALGSLDALRGAGKLLSDLKAEVKPDDRVIAWGGSQGGHAALFSSLYAPYYAPEYTITAVVALVPPANLKGQVEAALAAFSDSTVATTAASVSHSRWYGHETLLPKLLTDSAPNHVVKLFPSLMDTVCSVDEKKYKITQVSDLFTSGSIDAVGTKATWASYETWKCLFSENSLSYTSVKPKIHPPTLFQVSELDTLVNPVVQRKSFDQLCAAGYQLEYLECKGAAHSKGAIWSLQEQFEWVRQRLLGKPLTQVCKRGPAICCTGSDKGPCAP